jgi:hypothetical protein
MSVAGVNVKNRIRHASLLEDVLILSNFQDRFARPHLGEKSLRIELVTDWRPHGSLSDELACLVL